jgi:hypothetical protein
MTRFPAKGPRSLIRRSYPPGKRAVFNTGVAAAQPEDGRQFVSAPRSRRAAIRKLGSFRNFQISAAVPTTLPLREAVRFPASESQNLRSSNDIYLTL